MPPEQPLLTIAIPTYNRSAYLAQLLKSLAPQLKDEPRVEFLISDNASPDDTPALVQRFIENGLKVRYIRNATNIGSDKNFLQCFEKASGRYVWIVGDDDVIPAGTVAHILNLLTGSDYDLIYLRPMEFQEKPLSEWQMDRWKRAPEVIDNGRSFAKLIGNMLTMISCNIINKERVDRLEHPRFDELVGTGFVHLGWVYALLPNLVRGLYVFDILISVRGGNRGGYQVSRMFGDVFKSITDRLLVNHPALIRALYKDMIRNCLPFLILEVRANRFGDFEYEDFHTELKQVYGKYCQYWLFVFPAAKAPLRLAKAWFASTRYLIRVNFAMRLATQLMAHRLFITDNHAT